MSAPSLRWQCQSCDWVGGDDELLRAASPFDPALTIVGCPRCKDAEDFTNVCDKCDNLATCGFPSDSGYRRTCHKHYLEAKR